jgi:hypothetical protein
LLYHLFADDMQGLLRCPAADVPRIVLTPNDCFVDFSGWCASERLQLNASTAKVLLFGIVTNLWKIALKCGAIRAGSSVLESGNFVPDLGLVTDAQLSMREHMVWAAPACFFHLRRLPFIRQQLGRGVTVKLVVALKFSPLEYCSVVLAGLLVLHLHRYCEFSTPPLVNGLRPHDHVMPTLK